MQACMLTNVLLQPRAEINETLQYLRTRIHVNIQDLMDHRRSQLTGPVKTFRSTRALTQYTREEEKLFPKKLAKKNPLVKILLRAIYW